MISDGINLSQKVKRVQTQELGQSFKLDLKGEGTNPCLPEQ